MVELALNILAFMFIAWAIFVVGVFILAIIGHFTE